MRNSVEEERIRDKDNRDTFVANHSSLLQESARASGLKRSGESHDLVAIRVWICDKQAYAAHGGCAVVNTASSAQLVIRLLLVIVVRNGCASRQTAHISKGTLFLNGPTGAAVAARMIEVVVPVGALLRGGIRV